MYLLFTSLEALCHILLSVVGIIKTQAYKNIHYEYHLLLHASVFFSVGNLTLVFREEKNRHFWGVMLLTSCRYEMRERRKHLHQVPCYMGGRECKNDFLPHRECFHLIPKVQVTLPNRRKTKNTIPISKWLDQRCHGARDQINREEPWYQHIRDHTIAGVVSNNSGCFCRMLDGEETTWKAMVKFLYFQWTSRFLA